MGETHDPERAGLPPLLCADLQSKKLMVKGGLARSAEDVLDRSQHCWCERTCKQLGPDGDLAWPEDCTEGRSCYRSPYAGLS